MSTVTEQLADEINSLRGVEYPQAGYLTYGDIRGDGTNIRSLHEYLPNGGTHYSNLNGTTARRRVANMRAEVERLKRVAMGVVRYRITPGGEGIGRKPFWVPSVTPALNGHTIEGQTYAPDDAAVRDGLPARWRRVFDRAGGWWFDRNTAAPMVCHKALYDARGRHVVTLYAVPSVG